MKTKSKNYAILIITSLLFSCVNDVPGESADPDTAPTAELNILTRAEVETDDEQSSPEPIVLPVHIYVFTTSGTCAIAQTITDPGESLSLALPSGAYTIYALMGADPETYTLPDEQTAQPTSVISLKDPLTTHRQLGTAKANITLTDGDTTDLTLTLQRSVAQVTASITNLPEDISAVTIALEPLYQELQLNGEYTANVSYKASFALVSQPDGNWHTPEPIYLLPGEENATVTISLTTASGTKNYAYNSNIRIEANYKINITANYTVATGPDINGSIHTTDWAGTRDIIFDFGSGASTEEDDNATDFVTSIPAIGDTYKGCYVLDVTDISSSSANLLLVSPEQWKNLSRDEIQEAISQYATGELSNWRLPDESEARLLFNANNLPERDNDGYYLYNNAGNLRFFNLNEIRFTNYPANTSNKYHAYAVKLQRISVE